MSVNEIVPANREMEDRHADTNYGPFEMDDMWLSEHFHSIQALGQFMDTDPLKGWVEPPYELYNVSATKLSVRPVSRAEYKKLWKDLLWSGGLYLADLPIEGAIDLEIAATECLQERLKGFKDNTSWTNVMAKGIATVAQASRDLRQHSIALTEEVVQAIVDPADEHFARYELLKLLVNAKPEITNENTEISRPGAILANGLAVAAFEGQDGNLLARLRNEVYGGTYDLYIMQDEVNAQSQRMLVPEGTKTLQSFINAAMNSIGQTSEAHLRNKVINDVINSMNAEALWLVATIRQMFTTELMSMMDAVYVEWDGTFVSSVPDKGAVLDAVVDRLFPLAEHSPKTVKKAGQLPPSHLQTLVKEVTSQKKEAQPKQWQISRMVPRQRRVSQDALEMAPESTGESVRILKNEYLKNEISSDPQFAADIDRILTALQSIDFSDNQLRSKGVSQLGAATVTVRNMVSGHITKKPVFRFSPRSANSMSTQTNLADTVRVLFVKLENHTFGLIAITDKNHFKQTVREKVGSGATGGLI